MSEYTQGHPEHAAEIRELFPMLEALEQKAKRDSSSNQDGAVDGAAGVAQQRLHFSEYPVALAGLGANQVARRR